MGDWGTTSQSSVVCFRGKPGLFLCVLRLAPRILSYSLLVFAVLRFEALANVLASDAVPNPRDFSKSSFFLINRHISIFPCPYSMKIKRRTVYSPISALHMSNSSLIIVTRLVPSRPLIALPVLISSDDSPQQLRVLLLF